MSWSHSKTGTPVEVVESLSAPRGMQCVEPENGFKERALDLIKLVVSTFPEDAGVTLTCYGSQSTDAAGGVRNSLSISIVPVHKAT